ncbi:hypothetical protein [Loktanella sp. R86503]
MSNGVKFFAELPDDYERSRKIVIVIVIVIVFVLRGNAVYDFHATLHEAA